MTGVALELGAGEMDENPTISDKLAAFGAETGWGAAYWVAEVVVDIGGASEGKDGADVCTDGVADWKSSKSSSSAPLEVMGAAAGAEMGIGSSKENRSTSGSFFLGGSDFFGVRSVVFRLAEDEDEDVSACRFPGAATAPSSYSSYSSNLSLPPAAEAPRLLES